MRKLVLLAGAAALALTAAGSPAFADEPVLLSAAQLDSVHMGKKTKRSSARKSSVGVWYDTSASQSNSAVAIDGSASSFSFAGLLIITPDPVPPN